MIICLDYVSAVFKTEEKLGHVEVVYPQNFNHENYFF